METDSYRIEVRIGKIEEDIKKKQKLIRELKKDLKMADLINEIAQLKKSKK